MADQVQVNVIKVWGEKSPELVQEIIATWQKANALPAGVDASERAKEVVMIVRNTEGEIIGITTAKQIHHAPLKNDLFFIRGFIVPAFRVPGLFPKMIIQTLQTLEESVRQLPEERKPIGAIAEIENPRLKQANVTQLSSGMTLLGFSQKDNPVYVYYFKGSRY